MHTNDFTGTATWLHSAIWKCESCGNAKCTKCKECGHEHYECTELGIKVEGDFYCKKWRAKDGVAIPREVTIPNWPTPQTWYADDKTNITYKEVRVGDSTKEV